jgi:MFS family permease
LFIAGMLLVGFAARMEMVVLGRSVHGLGSGLLLVAIYVVIGRAYPEALRPGVFLAISAAWVVPSIVGPTIAGLTVQHLNWRWVFLSMPILAIPSAFLVRPALRMLGPTEHDPNENWNQRDALIKIGWSVLAAFGAAALHYGGERRDVIGIGLIVGAIVGLVLSGPKLLPAGTFRGYRGLPTVFILRGLVGAAFAGTEIYLPLLLSRERDFSPAMAGSILTIGGVTWFVGSWIRKRFDDRVEPARFVRTGALSLCIGISSVMLLIWTDTPVLVGVLGWGFAGLGMGLIYSSLSLLTLQLSTPAEQGKNSSSLQVAEALVVATVLALTGSAFAALDGRGEATVGYLVCFAVSLGLAFGAMMLSGRVRVGDTA